MRVEKNEQRRSASREESREGVLVEKYSVEKACE